MGIVTRTVLVLDAPVPDLPQWLEASVDASKYPAFLTSSSPDGNQWSLEVDLDFLGNNGQSTWDLHAAVILWMVGNLLAPQGINLNWRNPYVGTGWNLNTVGLEHLMDSPLAVVWLISSVRPAFDQKFPTMKF